MEFGQLDEDKFDVVDGVVDEKGFFFEDEAGDDGVETGEHLEVGDGEGNDGIELLIVFADVELSRVAFGSIIKDSFLEAFDVEDLHFDDDGGSIVKFGFDV